MKKRLFTYFDLLFLCVWQQVINKRKVTIKVKANLRLFLRRDTPEHVDCI